MDFATLSTEIPPGAVASTLQEYHAHAQVLQVMDQHTYNADIQEVSSYNVHFLVKMTPKNCDG